MMSKKLAALFLALLMMFSATISLAEITVTDMYGRPVALPEAAARIVALTAADCEILCALGGEDLLVGRGAYCNWPASIADVPVVQSGAETNLEEILALNPQVVLMADMAQSKDVVEQLEALGVRVAVSNADTIEGTYTAMRMIGALIGREAEAEALIADMQAAFADIAARAENTGKSVYFEVSPLQWGLWTTGSGTFMEEIAALCGLTNAFADVTGWAAISEEQVLERNPDYIVSISGVPGAAEEIAARPGWSGLKAVQNGCVFTIDADAISRPGPRLKDAALTLYGLMNGN